MYCFKVFNSREVLAFPIADGLFKFPCLLFDLKYKTQEYFQLYSQNYVDSGSILDRHVMKFSKALWFLDTYPDKTMLMTIYGNHVASYAEQQFVFTLVDRTVHQA